MKLTEAQKRQRAKAKLNYQNKYCRHLEIEKRKDNVWRCNSCNKEFKDNNWHGHEI